MMEKEGGYAVCPSASFPALDYPIDLHQHHHRHQQLENIVENSSMVDYLLNNPPPPHSSTSLDKLSFADVKQFADFGPKLGLNQPKISGEYNGLDPVYFLKFPVLNDKPQDPLSTQPQPLAVENGQRFNEMSIESEGAAVLEEREEGRGEEEEEGRESTSTRLRLLGGVSAGGNDGKNRRKRQRTLKTNEEVESQRKTHIAVERNRRKQMNEHLRVLRSLMPGSYVQRGDQASIIGGAIEFVRELEQLLQCLESKKRRKLFGSEAELRTIGETPPPLAIHEPASQTPFFPSMPAPSNDQMKILDFDGGLREESAEIKSCLGDIEVKLLGFDATIKILSRRRPGQLLMMIAALEDLEFNILHTNITTIEQTVLYSFNVKIAGESRFTAEDIANSVQQILNFIHASCL